MDKKHMKATEVLKKIGVALGINVDLEQIKLVDGVTILEADKFEAGADVFIVMEEELIPLSIGEYELEDGRILIIEQEGIIASVGESPAEEEAPVEEVVEEVQQGASRLPKKIIESITQEQHFAEHTPEDAITAVTEAEEIVTEEVVAIISELTPESVNEADASELANDVIQAVTDTLAEMPEEVAMKALSKIKKYGKAKMSDEEAQVVEEAKGMLVDSIASVVDAGTPDDVTPEISAEIAETIVDAVKEIVEEQPAELSAKLFRREKTQAKKVKNSAVSKRVEMAKKRIDAMKKDMRVPSRKPIKHNPENKQKTELKYKYASKRPETYMDKILKKLF